MLIRKPARRLLVENFRSRGNVPFEGAFELARLFHQLEFQEGRLSDEFDGPPRILHSRKFDEDPILPLLADGGLRNPELIDAVGDRLPSLVDDVPLDPLHLVGSHAEPKFPALFGDDFEGSVFLDGLTDFIARVPLRQGDDDFRHALFPHPGPTDTFLAAQDVPQFNGHPFGGVFHGLVHLDFQHQVYSALQIETESDPLRWKEPPPPLGHFPEDGRRNVYHPNRHYDGDDDSPHSECLRHYSSSYVFQCYRTPSRSRPVRTFSCR